MAVILDQPPDRYYDPPLSGGDDINLPFIIGLSSSLSFILLIVLVLAIYYIFFNDSFLSQEFQASNLNIPDSFSNMEDALENESLYLDKLSSDDQFYYKMSKKFQSRHKPCLTPMGQAIDLNIELLIKNRGIHCFYFQPYVDQLSELVEEDDDETAPLVNNQLSYTSYGSLIRNDIPFVIEDRTDISFLTPNPSSTILNLPLPTKNRHNDTIYFEVKLFEFDLSTTKISIGLSTKPNPNFRLPGEYFYSFALETTGHLKINKPLYLDDDNPVLTHQLVQGDVIGVGFKSLTGTVFITHNGKKKLDVIKNLKTDLYPCIGSIGGPSKVQVNLGQSGFVFIEANVKKLGFCESNNEGNLGAPPTYNKVVKKVHNNNTNNNNNNNNGNNCNSSNNINNNNNNNNNNDITTTTHNSNSSSSDIILEQGEELPPHYPDEEETFFGPKALISPKKNSNQPVAIINNNLPSKPPSYHSNNSSLKSESSDKIVKILSTKLQNQQEIPDKLLDLNQRYYEHSTSQFDKHENLDTTAMKITGQNFQNFLINDDEEGDASESDNLSTAAQKSIIGDKERSISSRNLNWIVEGESSSSSALIPKTHLPTDVLTSSSIKDGTSSVGNKGKKKKKKTKKSKKGKRN